MEVMEDGNLMDKVLILIQRDMEYYKDKQTILQETICPAIIGGRLDFPRSASFASTKLVYWWEEEYVAAYRNPSGFLQKTSEPSSEEGASGCGGIAKASDPSKFVNLISKSADQFLEHLHVLTQEALDHADLTVLIGTIGASALLKNCLWFYVQSISSNDQVELLNSGYKKYNEMCEALAERLLDLHCRLLSLYILQDAECLDWENQKSFSESERGSYIIQMWWLYMKGTKEELWNTVPPKMAQRVFSGMLNESLSILTVRYTQSSPSEARSQLLLVDISNLLLCVAQLLPGICDSGEDLIGLSIHKRNKILRDIHTKCQELMNCFILRGAPLDILYKGFRKGPEDSTKSRNLGPMPWITFALPNLFKDIKEATKASEFPSNIKAAIELTVLQAQPQPSWALLIRVLCMQNCKILELILKLALSKSPNEAKKESVKPTPCESFLCPSDGTCKNKSLSPIMTETHYYDLVMSLTNVVLTLGNSKDISEIFIPNISKQKDWAKCFERRHVWNQIRPPWFESILNLIDPLLSPILETVINACKTGASTYQAMSIILVCFSEFWDCAHPILPVISDLLQEFLPSGTIALNHSVLLQILTSALYTKLINFTGKVPYKKVSFHESETLDNKAEQQLNPSETDESIALGLAESLCSIDEDNKHTNQIEEFLQQVTQYDSSTDYDSGGCSRVEGTLQMAEVLVSELLLTTHGKISLKTIYNFLRNNKEWVFFHLGVSEVEEVPEANRAVVVQDKLLHSMFHIGYRPFDQILTGDWQPQWYSLLQIPWSLSTERIWAQLSLRWEFKEPNSSSLSSYEMSIITKLNNLLKL